MSEVRYQMLRPEQIVAGRQECPVVYIPLGTLEWHGLHNPVGADTLQAEGLAILCAEKGGGLVFPPLYYGESRVESLMEFDGEDRDLIAEKMELCPENFQADKHPFTATEQVLNYHKLLLHILAEAESLGFTVAVLVAGHYPLVDHARAAALHFNKRRFKGGRSGQRYGMLVWACLDYLLIAGRYDYAGDHAAGWETSHLLALQPQTVDVSLLPQTGQKLIGVVGEMPPQDASAEFGRETLEASAEVAVKEVKHRLENREVYFASGCSLSEGLWKQNKA